MKHFAGSFAAVALSLGLSLPAAALPIFGDTFDRPNDNTVGNGWTEQEDQVSDVAVQNGVLQLRGDDPVGMALLSGVSTVDFTDITLSYDWGPFAPQSDPGDFLFVSWRDGSNPGDPWVLLGQHDLGGPAGMTSASWSLAGAAGIADLELKFVLDVDFSNEGAYLDSVVLSGTRLSAQQPTQPVPEPGTLALAGLGLGLFGLARRRRG